MIQDFCPFCKFVYGQIAKYNSEVPPMWRIFKLDNIKQQSNEILLYITNKLGLSHPSLIPTPTLYFEVPNTNNSFIVVGATIEEYYEGILERLKEEAMKNG